MKKLGGVCSLLLIVALLLSCLPMAAFAEEVPEVPRVNQSRQLMTKGNQVVYADDPETVVQLVGLNVDSFEFSEKGWQMARTMVEAMDNWHANIIRLPVHSKYWWTEGYKERVDDIIKMASDRGKYVVLDLHKYEYFDEESVNFWKEAAEIYKNNPTVLFGILNEPHTISWKEWRDGGTKVNKGKKIKMYGHQYVVEMIRDLGAKNIIVAGGLDWGYDLRGIVGEAEGDSTVYALGDYGTQGDRSKTGYGIMYDTHIYPWKGRTADWDKNIGTARKKYALLCGENGWDQGTIEAIEGAQYPETSEKYYPIWCPEFFDFVNDIETYGAYLNWTGWCFHPGSSPRIIAESTKRDNYDYSYLPTDYWGVYVKEEMNKVFGDNLLSGRRIVEASGDYAELAIDGDYDTMWKADQGGDKHITVDLGGEYNIKRWAIRHSGAQNYREIEQIKNTRDFAVYTSMDGVNFVLLDEFKGNTAPVNERIVAPRMARYVKFTFESTDYQNSGVLRIKDLFVSGEPVDITEADVKIFDGTKPIQFKDAQPEIIEGTTMVPVRVCTEVLGGKVDWNAAANQATITLNGNVVIFTLGSTVVIENGVETELAIPVYMQNDKLMVPVRFVTEASGRTVDYYQQEDGTELIFLNE